MAVTEFARFRTGLPWKRSAGPELCCEFMWIWRQSGIEFFKHISLRRYLFLDSQGRCYRQTAVGFESADLDTERKSTRGD